MTADDDCWDAFGSDDDSDEEKEERRDEIALYLSQFFLKENPHVKLKERVVGVIDPSCDSTSISLAQRGFQVLTNDFDQSLLDALVILQADEKAESILDNLLPGGVLVTEGSISISCNSEFLASSRIDQSLYISRVKRAARAHGSTCPWLPSSYSITAEEERLQEATITLSVHEVLSSCMTETTISRAVDSLNKCGYVVIKNLLDPHESKKWGNAVLESVHLAAKILLDRDDVDILNPQKSKNEPQSYREMSMREDLRLDLRHGPTLSALRSEYGGGDSDNPVVLSGKTKGFDGFLRGHESLLDVIRRTMNPKDDSLFRGNTGRYNFDGSGPDGSFQTLRVSQVGGIASFPGAADQAIHADCPHLFENHPCLPAHYINIFTPGVPFDDKVGGTAFFHGSHNLNFTAKYFACDDNTKVYPFLVRPCLTLGDVVLFDCRVLHFGLSNMSQTIERVVLYSNTTQSWFHDPKNWEDKQRIFDN